MYVEILGEAHPAVMIIYELKLRLEQSLEHGKRPLDEKQKRVKQVLKRPRR